MKGFIAAVLDEETASVLREMAAHEVVFCKQITLAYNPSKEEYESFDPLLGHEIEFGIEALVSDDKGQAIMVSGVPTTKSHPYVTISCRVGCSPAYSNELCDLTRDNPQRIVTPVKTFGRATVQFVQHQGTR